MDDISSLSDYLDADDIISEDENIQYNKDRFDKNTIIKIQIETADRIINMFPKALEKHKKEIISSIIGNKEKEENLILTKIIINNDVYYRFNNGILLDNVCQVRGISIINNNNYIYFPFKTCEEQYKYLTETKKYNKYLEF